MHKVVTPKESKACDDLLISNLRVPGALLMEHAALGVAGEAKARLAEGGEALILCGPGNNGGDGLAVLRVLKMQNVRAVALMLSDSKLTGDALLNYEMAMAMDLPIRSAYTLELLQKAWDGPFSVIIDAMLGIGLSRNVAGVYGSAILRANSSDAFKIAVDIPSGINAATGEVMGCAFKADVSVTFGHIKRGHLLFPGKDYCGRVEVQKIAYMPQKYNDEYKGELLCLDDVQGLLPPRKANIHKGSNGRGLLIAGSKGFLGAAHMAGAAAIRGGVGLLEICVLANDFQNQITIPEAMVTCASAGNIEAKLINCHAVAIGPGIGKTYEAKTLVESVLKCRKPRVLDADALNIIAENENMLEMLDKNTIITPHPLELSRILHCDVSDILKNPADIAIATAQRLGCVVLLKGATSVIAERGGAHTFNTTGNPGLAKGGSGDVLTGIILALLCQGLSAYDAARVGAYILGASADEAYRILGNRMLIASDIISAVSLYT